MPVQLHSLVCQNCGADLKVDDSVRFVTCKYCSSRLEVVHDPSVTYTKVLEEMLGNQRSLEREMKLRRLSNQLVELDQNWERYREAVSIKTKQGHLIEPDSRTVLGPLVAGLLLVALSLSVGFQAGGGAMLLGGVLAGAILLVVHFLCHGIRLKAKEFRGIRHRYLRERTALKGQIHGLEKKQAARG
ncbi:DNA-directed RNA polymerase subunit RPC12/RpoP [Haloferula luteola]|uniref:DNA-directed RNA polymerase subunit RPC12/RpoP n=1 Tax=Haloferula luteola TaxID=595692 RepID=A0A840V5K0_9BACT|nr:hypothetical protein [Haloferula luteola]MBB5353517.1 DNA-directed RNA polymerase subunit RPC12/RpoP [Haloferula luteola]